MKIKHFTRAFFLLLVTYIFNSAFNPSNPPVASTGAPNESTCARSGCHTGTANFTGSVSISGVPATVVAGQTYAVTLTGTSNAIRSGFQLTCLDSTNVKCGNLVAGAGNNTTNSNGRQYVRQSSPKNYTNGSVSWSFNWTAPATLASPSIKFFYTCLAGNGNGDESGDRTLVGSFRTAFSTTATNEIEFKELANIYPNPVVHTLSLDLLKDEKAKYSIYNILGEEVLNGNVASPHNQIDCSKLNAGNYVLKLSTQLKNSSTHIIKL